MPTYMHSSIVDFRVGKFHFTKRRLVLDDTDEKLIAEFESLVKQLPRMHQLHIQKVNATAIASRSMFDVAQDSVQSGQEVIAADHGLGLSDPVKESARVVRGAVDVASIPVTDKAEAKAPAPKPGAPSGKSIRGAAGSDKFPDMRKK